MADPPDPGDSLGLEPCGANVVDRFHLHLAPIQLLLDGHLHQLLGWAPVLRWSCSLASLLSCAGGLHNLVHSAISQTCLEAGYSLALLDVDALVLFADASTRRYPYVHGLVDDIFEPSASWIGWTFTWPWRQCSCWVRLLSQSSWRSVDGALIASASILTSCRRIPEMTESDVCRSHSGPKQLNQLEEICGSLWVGKEMP